MFTGIVTGVGTIESLNAPEADLRRLRIRAPYEAEGIALGASIACGGPCLTVVARDALPQGGCWFEVDAARETLDRTTLGHWRVGDHVNLERALAIGDELGGHLVTGHVDGVAQILRRTSVTGQTGPWAATARFDIEAPEDLARFIAEKGSVTLDGTSLTVNRVEGRVFSVLLIPHTLQVTTWGLRQEGDLLNIEIDLMARYAARLSEYPKN
jgi:riboflavin synthase